ncbi:MAG: hypothetical protein ACYS22_19160 [Planctomycetota bacterium]|jgi:hypothetical protein
MDSRDWQRLRGLIRLVHDGVERGATFVEKHHRHAAAGPFKLLESIPPIGAPTRAFGHAYDRVLSLTYGRVRLANKITESVGSWALDRLESEAALPPACSFTEGEQHVFAIDHARS